MPSKPLSRAIQIIGLAPLAKELGVTYQAMRKWERAGRLPRTEWTGETNYALKIEALTLGGVRKTELLSPWTPDANDESPKPRERATA